MHETQCTLMMTYIQLEATLAVSGMYTRGFCALSGILSGYETHVQLESDTCRCNVERPIGATLSAQIAHMKIGAWPCAQLFAYSMLCRVLPTAAHNMEPLLALSAGCRSVSHRHPDTETAHVMFGLNTMTSQVQAVLMTCYMV